MQDKEQAIENSEILGVTTELPPSYSMQSTTTEPQTSQAQVKTAKHRGSGLLVGLSVGALVGGIIGGATGAIVSANTNPIVSETTANVSPTVITSPEHHNTVSAVASAATDSVVTVDVSTPEGRGSGSGVIYSSDGYIITNAHVVTTPGIPFSQTKVRVLLNDGSILPAEVVGTAPYADIAVLKIDAEGLPAIAIGNSEETSVGDLAIAIGAPFDLSSTLTSGVVSTIYRGIAVGSALIPGDENIENENPWNFDYDLPGQNNPSGGGQVTLPVIQTDADINPGNSGGALLNEHGELIGINVAIASAGATQDRAGSVGLGFAIPVKLASRVADNIISGVPVSHGLLGATVEDSRSSDTSTFRGGLVREVIVGEAADKAGIKSGDLITSINGIPTPDGTSVSAMVRYFESGTPVNVTFMRDGQEMTEEVILGSLT